MKKLLIPLFCLTAFSAAAKTLTLATSGKASYTVVTPQQPSAAEVLAAAELAKYLEEMSGTSFTVSDKAASLSIFVGLTTKFAPVKGAKQLQAGSETASISVNGKNIYLTGTDAGAVCHAVYGFLHSLGCRWFAPDYVFFEGRSRAIPHTAELRYIHKGDAVSSPAMKYRKFYVEEGLSHTTENLMQLIDWMPKLGYNTLVIPINYEGHGRVMWDNWRRLLTPELQKRGILIEVGGHGYQNYFNASMEDGRLYREHPEWFGMDAKGNRSTEQRVVFCTSNSDAVTYLHKSILAYLKSHPEIDIFDFWPPDGERWCECTECKKTTPPDRHIALVSQTARFLARELPRVRLECIAYSRYVTPPQHEKLDPSVLLDFCPINQNFETRIYEPVDKENIHYKEALMQWLKDFRGEISIYSYYRKYLWRSLPNIIPHYMQDELRFYSKVGAKGISIYSEPGDWFAYGPNYYVLGRLAQNPEADVDALMKEYSDGVFADAGAVALKVYGELENTVRFATRFPHTGPLPLPEYDKAEERIAACRAEVEAARMRTTDTVVKNHLDRMLLMLQYVTISIGERRQSVASGEKEVRNRMSQQVGKLISDNVDKGVFVVRHSR